MDREIRQNETAGESLTAISENGLVEESQGEQQEPQGDCMSHQENLTKPEEELTDSPLDVEETRRNINIMAESMNKWLAPRPWSATKTIQRFERKLETAVMRMASLGAVDEELEELSLAKNQEMEAEMNLSLTENVSKETSEVRLGRKDQEENSEQKP